MEERNLRGRQVVTFLCFLNFSIWLFDTFELRNSKASLAEAKFYSNIVWTWMQRINTLHAFAINHMYNAIDICRNVGNNLIENNWDRAFASLTGWAEEDDNSEGFLFFEVARYLCTDTDSCNVETDDSEINRLLMAAFEDGKTSLKMKDCDGAQEKVVEVQKLLLTALVDLTAFFAEVISEDLTDADNLAEGCELNVGLRLLFAYQTQHHLILFFSSITLRSLYRRCRGRISATDAES